MNNAQQQLLVTDTRILFYVSCDSEKYRHSLCQCMVMSGEIRNLDLKLFNDAVSCFKHGPGIFICLDLLIRHCGIKELKKAFIYRVSTKSARSALHRVDEWDHSNHCAFLNSPESITKSSHYKLRQSVAQCYKAFQKLGAPFSDIWA